MSLKISTWNVKHSQQLIEDDPSSIILERIRRVKATITEINADILLMVEGPKGEAKIIDFCHKVLDNAWVPVLLQGSNDAVGDRDRDYGYDMRGTQWLWYLVKPTVLAQCRIQAAIVWQSFIGGKHWQVNYWGQFERDDHEHFRQPQVLIYRLDNGKEIECIGVHLKSKINKERITYDAEKNLTGAYVNTALKARVKLATEARNIRHYVDAKFRQLEAPALVILGDCNDGPGQDYFESNYLFFDLIQNLQGEVLMAEKYFNHVLFDVAKDLRWTARFRDPILKIPASKNPLLIDHILVSQPLCNGSFPLKVNAKAGQVEHEIFERVNADSNSKTISSDHRPVSVFLSDNEFVVV
ncbi:endonuclease/exonuclease/phosphatase family protein [Winogradskyella ludwigii]|uniref:endonuclease/exonuclease/phosphatase family protein n=1 Tax=Winogradskyella ludwigii TaxID=2686076 RepID=UPI0015CAF47B|nr:endonuclease/exonuclease/phosphatase family protein [Winogradskyella ludwigii]